MSQQRSMKQEISAASGDDEENILINTFSFANDSGQLDMDTYGGGGASVDGDGNGSDAGENDNDLKIAIMEVKVQMLETANKNVEEKVRLLEEKHAQEKNYAEMEKKLEEKSQEKKFQGMEKKMADLVKEFSMLRMAQGRQNMDLESNLGHFRKRLTDSEKKAQIGQNELNKQVEQLPQFFKDLHRTDIMQLKEENKAIVEKLKELDENAETAKDELEEIIQAIRKKMGEFEKKMAQIEMDQKCKEFNVEKILGQKFDKKDRKIKYLIKWEGFDNCWNSWEPCENLAHLDIFKKYEAAKKADEIGAAHAHAQTSKSSANGVYKGTRPKAQKGKKRRFDFTD